MWGMPPYQPVQFVPYQSSPTGGDNKEYIRYLRKELKMAKSKDGDKKGEKKDEKKKEIWKRAEFIAIAFLTAPLLGSVYIGMLKLSWVLAQQILNH